MEGVVGVRNKEFFMISRRAFLAVAGLGVAGVLLHIYMNWEMRLQRDTQ